MILEEGRFEPSVYVWDHLSILFSLNIESDAPWNRYILFLFLPFFAYLYMFPKIMCSVHIYWLLATIQFHSFSYDFVCVGSIHIGGNRYRIEYLGYVVLETFFLNNLRIAGLSAWAPTIWSFFSIVFRGYFKFGSFNRSSVSSLKCLVKSFVSPFYIISPFSPYPSLLLSEIL